MSKTELYEKMLDAEHALTSIKPREFKGFVREYPVFELQSKSELTPSSYVTFLELPDSHISVEFGVDRPSVTVQIFDKDTLRCVEWNDSYQHRFFHRAVLSIPYQKVGPIGRARLGDLHLDLFLAFNFFQQSSGKDGTCYHKIPRALSEIIDDFDTDVEGCMPVNPAGEAKKWREDSVRDDQSIRKAKVVGVIGPAKGEIDLDKVNYDLNVRDPLMIPDIVRGLKAIKEYMDTNGVSYVTKKEMQRCVDRAKVLLGKYQIPYHIKPVNPGLSNPEIL